MGLLHIAAYRVSGHRDAGRLLSEMDDRGVLTIAGVGLAWERTRCMVVRLVAGFPSFLMHRPSISAKETTNRIPFAYSQSNHLDRRYAFYNLSTISCGTLYVHSRDTCDLHTSPDLRTTGDCSPCQINKGNPVIITHVLLKATKATRTVTLDLYRRTLVLDLQRGSY